MIIRRTSLAFLMLLSLAALAHSRQPAPKDYPSSINGTWLMEEHDFTALAEKMPEDKWSFAPTQGEFKGVRTFAEQVEHVACANFAFAKEMRHEKPPAHCDTGGPDTAKTKTELMKYLRDSFQLIDGEINHHQRQQCNGISRWALRRTQHSPGNYRAGGLAPRRPLWPTGGVLAHERFGAT